MCSMNLIYNPDHQQVLEHHNELLKKAEHEQLVRIVMTTPQRPLPSIRMWLRHWFSNRRSINMTRVASRSSSTNT